jgi:16S rRNA (guanine527-N7)-methyltransferase
VEQHKFTYHNVPRETFIEVDKLIQNHKKHIDSYLDLLLWWNQRVNLVSRSVSRGTLREHVRHSLLLTRLSFFRNSNLIIDAGTGGGLPGIPLAIANINKKFMLVDVVRKKTLAVRQMVRKLELQNTSASNSSIENIDVDKSFLLVSKHAFKIGDLYQMVSTFCWKYLVFYKGAEFEVELRQIETPLQVHVYRLDKSSHLDFYKNKVIIVIPR